MRSKFRNNWGDLR